MCILEDIGLTERTNSDCSRSKICENSSNHTMDNMYDLLKKAASLANKCVLEIGSIPNKTLQEISFKAIDHVAPEFSKCAPKEEIYEDPDD